ncbi:MAG: carboxypeptidase-like regulatory domain-containing protein [Planctomycetota bacterium]
MVCQNRCDVGLLCVFVIVMASGCSRSPVDGRPTLVPVTGTVLYKQQPIEGATVLLVPTDHEFAAAGKTDASGTFQLRTFDPDDGAAPGKFTVTVKKFEFLYPPGGGEIEKQLLPVKYGNPTSSGLTATVVEGEENDLTFELND